MSLRRPTWLDQGEEPDYRFSLANERTFLAWIRTSLALLAAAVAVVQLVPTFHSQGVRTALGVALGIAGLGSAVLTYPRWAGNERAMRQSKPLPYPHLLLVLSMMLGIIGVCVLVLVITSGR